MTIENYSSLTPILLILVLIIFILGTSQTSIFIPFKAMDFHDQVNPERNNARDK
jgi:hypothetical protein